MATSGRRSSRQQPLHLPLGRHRRLLRDADQRAQFLVRARRARDARLEALLARDQRLPPFRQVLGQPVQRGVDDQRLPGACRVLGVDVQRDLLQEDEQARIERQQVVDLPRSSAMSVSIARCVSRCAATLRLR